MKILRYKEITLFCPKRTKHETDKKHSPNLAKWHLNFNYKEENATFAYNEPQKHEKDFLRCLQNELCVEEKVMHILVQAP